MALKKINLKYCACKLAPAFLKIIMTSKFFLRLVYNLIEFFYLWSKVFINHNKINLLEISFLGLEFFFEINKNKIKIYLNFTSF